MLSPNLLYDSRKSYRLEQFFCGTFQVFVGAAIVMFLLSTQAMAETAEDNEPQFKVLVFSRTTGFRHDSIPAGIQALRDLGKKHRFSVEATEDPATFTTEGLEPYQVVVFLNTSGDVLNAAQQIAFRRFIQQGKGFAGVHAASDTEYDWPWYGKLVGAYFASHPRIQKAQVEVTDRKHRSTSFLPEQWQRRDEWYNFRKLPEDVQVLLKLNTESYEGSTLPGDHPVAWYQKFDGGRSFYTAGGHTKESYAEPLFLRHLLGGLQWVAGDAVKSE